MDPTMINIIIKICRVYVNLMFFKYTHTRVYMFKKIDTSLMSLTSILSTNKCRIAFF